VLKKDMYDEIKKCYECVKKNEQNRKEQSILRNNPDFISCKKYLKLNVWIDTVQ
jgi:hypothetical protein